MMLYVQFITYTQLGVFTQGEIKTQNLNITVPGFIFREGARVYFMALKVNFQTGTSCQWKITPKN